MAGEAGIVGTPPAHYVTESGLQPFDVIDAYGFGFFDGNALKYLLRAGRKGSMLDDLKKSLHYIQETIIRWDRGDIIPAPANDGWRKLTTYDVGLAFGLTGYTGTAAFYLMSWRCDKSPDKDIRKAAMFIERAIKELEAENA